jgi:ATP-dependent helicase/nuclease subunit B
VSTTSRNPHSGSVVTQKFSASTFLDDVARHIVDAHQDALPQLSGITILIAPRAATALRTVLSREAAAHGVHALMLPRITTLRAWAGEIHVGAARVVADTERVLEVFSVLKKQRWFSAGETLALSHELVRLANELTDQLVTLPGTIAAHMRTLTRAYGIAKQNAHFSFEAQLTYDVWRTLAEASAQSMDAATRYGLQLANLAAAPAGPLYVVGQAETTKREAAFFEAYANGASVTQFSVATNENATARERFVAQALVGAPGMAGALPTQFNAAAPSDLQCYAARGVEDEAGAALNTIKTWLLAGRRHIAVVALDRLAARRLRALAERDQILMADEIGWPYSTTLSATAVMRWLEAKRDGFYYQTLIDLLKSPFMFADLGDAWGAARVKQAVLTIEHAIRRAGVVAGLLRVREAVLRTTSQADESTGDAVGDAVALLDRLLEAERAFNTTRKPAAAWLSALQQSLVTLGLQSGLARDAAGTGLLDLLSETAQDVINSRINLSMSEWTDWLRTRMEDARFRDVAIDSPVVITSLEATRFRRFDAVLLLGAAAGNLPGKPANIGLFNQAVRHTLGLPTQATRAENISEDLLGLMARSDACWISWQGKNQREPALPAPWVSALLLAAIRGGGSLLASLSMPLPETPLSTASFGRIASKPAPMLAFQQVPRKISASGYQQLIDCPYQFFAQSVLKLRETDDVTEEMEKRDFGELVHAVLNRFHQKYPIVSSMPWVDARAALIEETADVFAVPIEQSFVAHAWRLQWETAIDSYLDWQTQRESKGWRWQAGELAGGFDLPLENGETLRLEGRLDRLDLNGEHTGVIDYKARDASALAKKLKSPGEDVQLAVYAALAEAKYPERAVTEAAYLAIKRHEVKPVPYPEPQTAGADNVARLSVMFEALYAGAPLPAQGVDAVCTHCAARGLCRKDYWAPHAEGGQDG